MNKIFIERIFRRPRLWSNEELRKVAHLFSGDIVNVSGWRDYDKSVDSYLEYYFGNCNLGARYQSYFTKANSYTITNYPGDRKNENKNSDDIYLDLEENLPSEYHSKFDVVFNHTVLEHVFDVFKAFDNLCKMSKDIVILVIPFIQPVHDFQSGYRDYWRFTPFAVDKLFEKNGLTVLYRASNKLTQSSVYYFYIASKKPELWREQFNPEPLRDDLKTINLGRDIFYLSFLHLRIEGVLRRFAHYLKGKFEIGK